MRKKLAGERTESTVRLLVLLLPCVGCGAAGASPAAPRAAAAAEMVRIAAPCDGLETGAAPVALFVEVVEVRSKPASLSRVSRDQVSRLAGVLIDGSGPVTVPGGEERESPWTVRALRLPASSGDPVELELRSSDDPAGPALWSTTNQAAKELSYPGGRSVVVTPYYLFEPRQESLETLRQCKLRSVERVAPKPS